MSKGVELLLRHCAGFEDRLPARDRVAAMLGEELTCLLLSALRPGGAGQLRGGRLSSSSPYSRT
jgi:hypothetical protein